jgi:hypothetical protein
MIGITPAIQRRNLGTLARAIAMTSSVFDGAARACRTNNGMAPISA